MDELWSRLVVEGEEDGEGVDGQATEDLKEWINRGRPGLKIGWVTKGGVGFI